MNSRDMAEAARAIFAARGFSYRDITTGDILALVLMLNTALKAHDKGGEMKLRLSQKLDVKQRRDGSITECYLYVNGSYFSRREAISFNEDGFIGFCGWADAYNTKPFTDTFFKWVDALAAPGGKDGAA